jgi:hypothetical protein
MELWAGALSNGIDLVGIILQMHQKGTPSKGFPSRQKSIGKSNLLQKGTEYVQVRSGLPLHRNGASQLSDQQQIV